MSSPIYEIEKLYIELLNRPAESAGLNFWVNEYNKSGGNLAGIAHSIEQSAEFQALYGGHEWTTGTGLMVQVYNNLFGHNPDMQALNTWAVKYIGALVDHTSIADLNIQMADAATGADLVYLNQRVVNALNQQGLNAAAHDAAPVEAHVATDVLLVGVHVEQDAVVF
ncbi:DUF4214 domain-containing protein [Massilia sp. MB5]|uniref:DUF4214 domain-containing protein n=1 Tax=Massilia sp. MB5 TaxID=2919578 RepID=UPI001F1087A3|nr:DUF4214 domain-containing protein [Massilia sp. MB5]UMR32823.1 DUF4214 domain-containing protein [Massilia sp. MB5]